MADRWKRTETENREKVKRNKQFIGPNKLTYQKYLDIYNSLPTKIRIVPINGCKIK